MTTSSKNTPRVEALNRLLTWVEEMEEHYEDREGFDTCDIEDRVSCFITYVVGNALTQQRKDPKSLPVSLLYATTVSAVRDLFDHLEIIDDLLAQQLIHSSILACAGVILDIPCDDEEASDELRDSVADKIQYTLNVTLKDLLPT